MTCTRMCTSLFEPRYVGSAGAARQRHGRLDPSSHCEYKRAWSSLESATRVTNPALPLHAQILSILLRAVFPSGEYLRTGLGQGYGTGMYLANQKTITHALHLQRYTKSPHFKDPPTPLQSSWKPTYAVWINLQQYQGQGCCSWLFESGQTDTMNAVPSSPSESSPQSPARLHQPRTAKHCHRLGQGSKIEVHRGS
ncbi:hypothetical protein CI102_8222 [Trichoderma harzianum]|nr:hypothetical protein CI102_8222 [Trichoderma harzianum]